MAHGKILLVDDDADYSASMAELLEGEGLGEILVAKNGREALALLDELAQPPSLILLDVAMPEMDGRELLSALQGRLAEIPVIVCSGHKKVEAPQVVAQLPKPVDIAKLLDLCSRLARRKEG